MALSYRGDKSYGNIEITLALNNNAGGTFGLFYDVAPKRVAVPAQHVWVDHAVYVIPPMPDTINLIATVYNDGPGGNAGNLILRIRQGTAPLLPADANAPPGNPCDLGQVASNATIPPVGFAVML